MIHSELHYIANQQCQPGLPNISIVHNVGIDEVICWRAGQPRNESLSLGLAMRDNPNILYAMSLPCTAAGIIINPNAAISVSERPGPRKQIFFYSRAQSMQLHPGKQQFSGT